MDLQSKGEDMHKFTYNPTKYAIINPRENTERGIETLKPYQSIPGL